MPHNNGHGNGHQRNDGHNRRNGRHSLPEKASFGKNRSIPEGYDPSDSGSNFVAIGMLLLTALLGCGVIAFILLLFQ